MNSITSMFFESLGLEGSLLSSISDVVRNEEDLANFQMYILDNEGAFKSNVHLIHQYIKHLQSSICVGKNEFVIAYKSSFLPSDRTNVLSLLFVQMVTELTANKIHESLEKGLTIEFWYDKLVEYRNAHTPEKIVELVLAKHSLGLYQ